MQKVSIFGLIALWMSFANRVLKGEDGDHKGRHYYDTQSSVTDRSPYHSSGVLLWSPSPLASLYATSDSVSVFVSGALK